MDNQQEEDNPGNGGNGSYRSFESINEDSPRSE